METTKVFSMNLAAFVRPDIRIIANKGGSRSSKTWSILQLLNLIAAKSTRPRLISVVSESIPHLKRGCIRDFERMLKDDKIYNPANWNATDKIYTVGQSKIEFFGADQYSKVQGPARDILFINEAVNLSFDVYRQLAVRTTEKILLDYNPTHEFWVNEKVLPFDDALMIHSTYLDNDMLSTGQIQELIKQGEIDPDFKTVFVDGQTGSLQGLIIKNWDIVASMPKEFKHEYIGVDFGYSDPTAIMHIRIVGGEIYIDEICYERGLDNPDIADRIKAAGLGHLTIVADSAEPKSIREVARKGLTVLPADKGEDSVRIGLQIMNRYKKHYTQRSVNSIRENRMYRWMQDSSGNYIGKPTKAKDTHHAKDAERYVFLKFLSDLNSGFDFSVISTGRR